MTKRTCVLCEIEFSPTTYNNIWCKQCRNQYSIKDRTRLRYYRNKSLKLGFKSDLSIEDISRLLQTQCYYCDTPDSGTIDRVNNYKGYTLDNCVAACSSCNHIKSNHALMTIPGYISRLKKIEAKILEFQIDYSWDYVKSS